MTKSTVIAQITIHYNQGMQHRWADGLQYSSRRSLLSSKNKKLRIKFEHVHQHQTTADWKTLPFLMILKFGSYNQMVGSVCVIKHDPQTWIHPVLYKQVRLLLM